ncbi:MAG: transposase, partial [Gemmatimonadota bacterium]
LGADKAYDTADFVHAVRARGLTPHVAQNTSRRRSSVDRRTTRHGGYAESQKRRHRIEESYGWCKVIGLLGKLRHRGLDRVGWVFTFTLATYNLVRMKNLIVAGVAP